MNRSQEIADTKNLNAISFQPSNVTDLEAATRVLAEKRKALTAGQPTEEQVWEAVEATLDLAKLVARNRLASPPTPGRTDAPAQPAGDETKGKEKGAKSAAKDLPTPSVEKAVKDLEEAKRELTQITNQRLAVGVDREYATAMFAVIDKIQSQPESDQVKALALGQVYTTDLSNRWSQVYSSFLEDLIEAVERSDHLSDCSLREEIAKIRLPAGTAAGRDALRDVKAIYEAGNSIQDLLKRYVRDCVCAAMLPPCPACDDTAVLLACLEVRDCKVIDICNLARSFVISPVAFRYWVPVGLIGEALESFCCPDMCEGVEAPRPTPAPVPGATEFVRPKTEIGTVETIGLRGQVLILNLFRYMAKACGATYTDREVAQVLSVLASLFRDRFGDRRAAIGGRYIAMPAAVGQPPEREAAQPAAEARIDEAAVQAAVSKAVSDFINQATLDESSEFGRSVLALVEKKIAESKPKRGTSK